MNKKPKVLITGASGMLGSVLLRELSSEFDCVGLSRTPPPSPAPFPHECCDVTDREDFVRVIHKVRPDTAIQCAALVSVDGCEKDKKSAYAVHVESTKTLIQGCAPSGAKVVYVSTDSVFDGQKAGAYNEKDQVRPLNVYGLSKWEGEQEVLALERGLVLRTNIFGWTRMGRSFGEWVLSALRTQEPITMFTDVFFTPMSTFSFAQLLRLCLARNLSGLYHAGGADKISKYDFARKVAALYRLSMDRVSSGVLGDVVQVAPRAKNMALDSSKLSSALGENMPDLQSSLKLWKRFEPQQLIGNG